MEDYLEDFTILLDIGKRKNKFDQKNSWSEGSKTYLNEIIKEIDEVKEELEQNRICYLEDELGDVLWDYINILLNLENERKISIESVLKRACLKYEERISGIENAIPWNIIKEKQKIKLRNEDDKIKKGI